ncbi:hypothetical protein nbrc107696_09910 [Gordonia spumicola]|uniref:DUF5642 domain-containing protein n=1 Tax=Gordonia spumicola TaxID=589161 RepID=A0A7I9V549_9ACTN|nr:hypothetical protein [Gordonia spumicola]GEE00545.1 hypothetical protein nbrc107696_09910 [Gordonia spumicola]
MSTVRTRLIGGLLALTAVGAVAACGDEAPAVTAPQDLVLAAGDYPKGYDLKEVSKQQVLTEVAKGEANSKTTPAQCDKGSVFAPDTAADDFGLSAAKNGAGDRISEFVVTSPRDTESFRQAITGDCAKVTTVNGPTTEIVVSEPLDAPAALAGKPVFVFGQVRTTKANGKSVTNHEIGGAADVDGRLVRVQYVAAGADVDRAAFDEAFTRAVEKAAG